MRDLLSMVNYMDSKFPRFFLSAMALYAFTLIWGIINLIAPSIQFGVFLEFVQVSLPVTIIILSPLILFVLYFFDDKMPFLERHETAMRTVIIALVAVSFMTVFIFTYDQFLF